MKDEPIPGHVAVDAIHVNGKLRGFIQTRGTKFSGESMYRPHNGPNPEVDDLLGRPQRKHDISVDESLKFSEYSI